MNTLLYDNRYALWLSILVLLIAGLSALFTLPRLEDPRIANRNPVILIPFPGASAEQVESQVTDVIEDELRTIHEIKELRSESQPGFARIIIELADWVDESTNQNIFSEIRDRMDDAAAQFPEGAQAPFFDDTRNAIAYTLIVALHKPDERDLPLTVLHRLALELADRLRNISNTELVRIYGELEEEIVVRLDEDSVAAIQMTPADISARIQQSDAKTAAGTLHSETYDLELEVRGALDSVTRVGSIPISQTQNGSMVLLRDVAQITKEWQTPPREIGLVDGKRSILVAARMEANVRIEHWAEKANEVLNAFRDECGDSVGITVAFEQVVYTNQKLQELTGNLLGGIAIVLFVVFIFMGWKPSLTVGLALPLSLSAALFSLAFFDQGIHQMSIFGMIIAIGLLIDNAIVVTNDVRIAILERGMTPRNALIHTVTHLRGPLFSSTITTVLGFMPIFLMNGNAGDFVGPIAISVVLALLFSFAISLTVIVTVAAISVSSPSKQHRLRWWVHGVHIHWMASGFEWLLQRSIRHGFITIPLCLILPLIGFLLAGGLPLEFFPSADRDHFEIKIWFPSHTTIEETARVAVEMDRAIRELEGVTQLTWMTGSSHPYVYYNQMRSEDNAPNYAGAIVYADRVDAVSTLVSQVQALLDRQFPQARSAVRVFGQGPPTFSPIEFQVLGPDVDTLRLAAETVRLAMSRQSEITHHYATIEGGEPKLWLDVDEDEARLAGFTLRGIANQVNSSLNGHVGGSVLEQSEELPVRVRLDDRERSELGRVESLRLLSSAGEEWVPMTALGTLTLEPEVTGISRKNGERMVSIRAFMRPDAKAIDVTMAIENELDTLIVLPPEYRLEVGGDAEEQGEALQLLAQYLPVLLTLMVATLILTFRSVALAGLIGMVAFLSAGLGMLSLALAGLPLGFNPIIGSTGLIGVAINDTIIVLAAIRANARAQAGDLKEIVNEVMGTSRHIFSTTLTTAGGFAPLLLSGGTFWPPLAVVIAGGILFATYLALFFTPAVYYLLAKWISPTEKQEPST